MQEEFKKAYRKSAIKTDGSWGGRWMLGVQVVAQRSVGAAGGRRRGHTGGTFIKSMMWHQNKQTAHQKWLWIGPVPYCNATICITVTATICAQSWASFKCTERRCKKKKITTHVLVLNYLHPLILEACTLWKKCPIMQKKKKHAEWTECVIMRMWTTQLSVWCRYKMCLDCNTSWSNCFACDS